MKNNNTTHRPSTAVISDPWIGNFGKLMNEILHEPQIVNNRPLINLTEKENGYELLVALPGVQKKDISISIEDHVLNIAATSSLSPLAEGDKALAAELRTTEYNRALRLPKNADTETTDATLDNGILKLYIAKRKESLPREIKIK